MALFHPGAIRVLLLVERYMKLGTGRSRLMRLAKAGVATE
jgi:hypothetical protein